MVVMIVLGFCLGLAMIVFWVQPLGIAGALERLTPNIVYRVETTEPLVALSFDDGPHAVFTPQVLEMLRHYEARATFFLIGERALRHPELVDRIKAEGHEVGNHYWRNGATLGDSDEEFVRNLENTEKAIGVREPKLFRAPGGVAWSRQLRLAKARGYSCVLGTAYPHDPMHPPVGYMRWLIRKNLAPGTIVILHDGIADATRSIKALAGVLEDGRAKGLRFLPIGEVMRHG
jgi:peptidoglycan-N-acetylglucosamine deacetylase